MMVVLSPVVQLMVRVSSSWLRERIDAGVSVRTVAAELNITERTVRNRLQRAGIPLPSEVKAARSTSTTCSPHTERASPSCASQDVAACRRDGSLTAFPSTA